MRSALRYLSPCQALRSLAAWCGALAGALLLATAGPAVAQSPGDLDGKMSFAPSTIQSGKPTKIRVRLDNTNDGTITNIAFDLLFVPGMRMVGTLDPFQCGGNVDPVNGGITMRGASLGSSDSCDIAVDVTVDSDTTRDVTLSIGPITSRGGGTIQRLTATLTVLGGIPPKITSPPLPPTGMLGIDYFHQVTVTGTAPVVVTAEGLPPGLSYDDATRRVTGAPTLSGVYLVTLRATNGVAPPDAQVSQVEIRNPPLQIVTPPPLAPPLVILAPVTLVVEATGGLKPYRFDLAAGALPPGLALAEDGKIVGAPTTPGTYAFTVRVRDVLQQVDVRAYELVVMKIATTLKLGIAPNPAVAGQVVVLTANVEASIGPPPPGTIEAWIAGPGTRCPDPFESGSDPITPIHQNAALAGGVAQLSFPDLSIGRFRVCARYGGGAQHEVSTLGPVDLFVIKGILLPAPKMLLEAPSHAWAGGKIAGRVTLETAGTAIRPSGAVRVRAGHRDLGDLALVDGVASFSVAAPDGPGVVAITASYAGDGAFSPAVSAPAYVMVSKAVVGEPIPATGAALLALLAFALASLGAVRLRRRR
ncbi:MAG: Ig-like domain repeat protein [Betaproteobacteria bacterium]